MVYKNTSYKHQGEMPGQCGTVPAGAHDGNFTLHIPLNKDIYFKVMF